MIPFFSVVAVMVTASGFMAAAVLVGAGDGSVR